MEKMTAVMIAKALDGLTTRAAVIAQNIANVNSQSYAPKKVSFEAALGEAAKIGPNAVAKVEPQVSLVDAKFGTSDIRLDLEMASASHTAMRYAALVDMLNRQMQLTRLAIRGGQ